LEDGDFLLGLKAGVSIAMKNYENNEDNEDDAMFLLKDIIEKLVRHNI
jgi:hypothetical protein